MIAKARTSRNGEPSREMSPKPRLRPAPKCWKPRRRAFSVVAFQRDSVDGCEGTKRRQAANRRHVRHPAPPPARFAASICYGRIENKRDIRSYGLDSAIPNLSTRRLGSSGLRFVSALIESGVPPSEMDGIQVTPQGLGMRPMIVCSAAAGCDSTMWRNKAA